MTLEQQIVHILSVFEKRNGQQMTRIEQRLAFLNAGIRQFDSAFEKQRTDQYERWLASIFARWVAAITMAAGSNGPYHVAEKFGAGCAYCGKIPCGPPCSEDARPEPKYLVPTAKQVERGIKDWQEHLNRAYGAKNKTRGIDKAIRKLYNESGEALDEWLLVTVAPPLDRFDWTGARKHLIYELIDVFARLIAVANILDIDLEAVVVKHYENGCGVCNENPCDCKLSEYVTRIGKANTTFV